MNADAIREFLRREPFEPFVIRMSNGEARLLFRYPCTPRFSAGHLMRSWRSAAVGSLTRRSRKLCATLSKLLGSGQVVRCGNRSTNQASSCG